MKRNFALLCMAVLLIISCQPKTEIPAVNVDAEKATLNAICDRFDSAFIAKDAALASGFLTEDALITGTDPSEFWTKKQTTDMWIQSFADTTITVAFNLDKRDIRVASDGKSAMVTEQFIMPALSEKIFVRAIFHAVKAENGWKCDYLSWNLIPKNEDIVKLNEALKEPDAK